MNLFTSVAFSIAIGAGLIITILVAREAWRRGIAYAHQDIGNIRTDYARALEEQENRHLTELADLQSAHAVRKLQFDNLIEQARADAKAVEAEYSRLHDIQADKLHAALMATLTPSEIELLKDMSDKLRLASPAFHAQQQFADARKAKELAVRGGKLHHRLLPENIAQEDAA